MTEVHRRYPVGEGERLARIEWKCSAVVDDDSVEFAKKLQGVLNGATDEGFALVQTIGREIDRGFIVVHQRATFVPEDRTTTGLGQPQDEGERLH